MEGEGTGGLGHTQILEYNSKAFHIINTLKKKKTKIVVYENQNHTTQCSYIILCTPSLISARMLPAVLINGLKIRPCLELFVARLFVNCTNTAHTAHITIEIHVIRKCFFNLLPYYFSIGLSLSLFFFSRHSFLKICNQNDEQMPTQNSSNRKLNE